MRAVAAHRHPSWSLNGPNCFSAHCTPLASTKLNQTKSPPHKPCLKLDSAWHHSEVILNTSRLRKLQERWASTWLLSCNVTGKTFQVRGSLSTCMREPLTIFYTVHGLLCRSHDSAHGDMLNYEFSSHKNKQVLAKFGDMWSVFESSSKPIKLKTQAASEPMKPSAPSFRHNKWSVVPQVLICLI